MFVDVLIVGDFRFPGGTSSAIVSEVRALAAAGYSVGLMSLSSGPFGPTRGLHAGLWGLVRQGLASFVPPATPVRARLTCLHHPKVFEVPPATPSLIDSEHVVLVVHHPPMDATGRPQYDIDRIREVTQAYFGTPLWAPVGPGVRAEFAKMTRPPPLTTGDWLNTIDVDLWMRPGRKPPRGRPVIGRHSRPEAVKWPDTRAEFLGAYPADDRVRVRLMGYDAALDAVVGARPANWETLPFDALPVADFLGTLDYFSYHHGSAWIEAFGRAILEAMASGLVCLLPEHFAPVFGEGAMYGPPESVLDTVLRLEADPAAYRRQSQRAVEIARSRFGPQVAVDRVRALIGAPGRASGARHRQQTTGRVLYLTSNGIGMGHITRCLASAVRLEPSVDKVLVTMSKAFEVASDMGVRVEYIPFFRSIGLDHDQWTAKLDRELRSIFAYHDPNVLVFDGNVPYDGLLAALERFPQLWSVWLRRGMWRPGSGEVYVARESAFDLVIEPGELAADFDRGPTRDRAGHVLRVPPVRLLDRDELLPRQAARRLLGIAAEDQALLLQLGSGNNFDTADIVRAVADIAHPHKNRRRVRVFFARWRISNLRAPLPDWFDCLEHFPIARFLNAFDGAVALAGYNTFHENIDAGLPTLFLANENPEQDEQGLRADYAALRGLALSVGPSDPHGLARGISAILEPATQMRLRAACADLSMENGARRMSEFLSGLAVTRKALAPGVAAPGMSGSRT